MNNDDKDFAVEELAVLRALSGARSLPTSAVEAKARLGMDVTLATLRALERVGAVARRSGLWSAMVNPEALSPSQHQRTEITPMPQKPTTQDAILAMLPAEPGEVIKRTKLSAQAVYSAANQMKKAGLIRKVGKEWVRADGKPSAPARSVHAPPRAVPDFLKPDSAPFPPEIIAHRLEKLRAERGVIDKMIEMLEGLGG